MYIIIYGESHIFFAEPHFFNNVWKNSKLVPEKILVNVKNWLNRSQVLQNYKQWAERGAWVEFLLRDAEQGIRSSEVTGLLWHTVYTWAQQLAGVALSRAFVGLWEMELKWGMFLPWTGLKAFLKKKQDVSQSVIEE